MPSPPHNAGRTPDSPPPAPDADAERLRELEIKVAFLERHIEEQDRVMLDNFRAFDRLQREVRRLTESLDSALAARDSAAPAQEEPPPPHY